MIRPELAGISIISGGQTGCDRGGLEAGKELGLRVGGYCPKGRLSEDGPIPMDFPLVELQTSGYTEGFRERTRRNVQESDATLLFTSSYLTPGTKLTKNIIQELKKPHLVVEIDEKNFWDCILGIHDWLLKIKPSVLNVAGPRESKHPGAQSFVKRVLVKVFSGSRN